jgi:hypothetical protein
MSNSSAQHNTAMPRSRSGAPNVRGKWLVRAWMVLACVGATTLGACSSVLSEMPTQMGGLPSGAPSRPEAAPAYPAVHEMPPPRSAAVLTEEERKKVEAELAAMRAEQKKKADAKGQPE